MITLSLSLIFLFCSILIFFDLVHPLLWKITIAATEYGHFFFLAPLSIAIAAGTATPQGMTATVFSLLSVVILLYPSFSAMMLSRSLPRQFSKAFGESGSLSLTEKSFRWRRPWFGTHIPEVRTEVLSFTPDHGVELPIHFFHANSNPSAPCVIVIHTGGWDSGSPTEFEQMNRFLASRGYAVAALSYRFAPQFIWPAQKDDVLAAIQYLKTNAVRLGVDPARLILFGRSAGGQIAEAVAYTANDPAIKGCIGFYAPADLIFAYEHLLPEPDILDSRTLLHNYLGGSLNEKRSLYQDASSYHHVESSTPPTLLMHGSNDPLTWYRQSERLSAKLTEHSIPHLYIELPWATHAFDYNFNGPGGQVSSYAILRFLSCFTHR